MSIQKDAFLLIQFLIFSLVINSNYINDLYYNNNYLVNSTAILFIALLIIIIFNFFIFKANIDIEINNTIVFIFIWWFYTLLNYIYVSPSKHYGEIKLKEITISIFLSIVPFLFNYNLNQFKRFINFYLLFLFIFLILMFIKSPPTNIFSNERLEIGNINPIWTGRILGETTIIVSYLLQRKLKFFKYLLITVFILNIISTGSKGPLFSLILSIFLVHLLRYRFKIKKNIFLKNYIKAMLAICGLFLFFKYIVLNLFNNEFLIDRFIISNSESSYGSRSRTYLFALALDYFMYKPIFGNGLGSFGFLLNGYDVREYPHNILLETLSEMGLIGLFLLLIPVVLTIKKYIKYIKYYHNDTYLSLLMTLFIYYFFNSLVSGDLAFYNSKFYLFMIFMNYYVIQMSKSKKINIILPISKSSVEVDYTSAPHR